MTLDIEPSCLSEPVQQPTRRPPFNIQMRGIKYRVTPLYSYDISGLIPSARQYTKWPRGDFYKRHGDTANIADIALLWGHSNTDRDVLKNFKFSHSGAWVVWRSRIGSDRSVWSKFQTNKISNNHILSDSKEITKKLENLHKWDQVSMKGYLVSYSGGTTRNRKSSTTRIDTGNGACEVFYVTDLRVIHKASTRLWSLLHKISWGLLIIAICIHFKQPVRLS